MTTRRSALRYPVSTLLWISAWIAFASICAAEEEHPRWILVTTPALKDAFEPLVSLRQKQGYEVQIIVDWATGDTQDNAAQAILAKLSTRKQLANETLVLIGGTHLNEFAKAHVPTPMGVSGRMRDLPTDYPYSLPDKQGFPTLTVGRLPARNEVEVAEMVGKIIRTEHTELAPDAPHLNLIVANPGGKTGIEKQFGEMFLSKVVEDRLANLDPQTRVEVLADIPKSKFYKSENDFGELATAALTSGGLFHVYCGHSSAAGLWSQTRFVVTREDFAELKVKQFPGVFMSCGCFTSQINAPANVFGEKATKKSDTPSQGFGIAAIRNPNGPSAVIGPYEESYAAFGKFAMDALFERAVMDEPATTIGDYWNSVQRGLLKGKMETLMFFMFDQADGSRGKTTLAKQRPEHVEMWSLLGDPAMRLPPLPNSKSKSASK